MFLRSDKDTTIGNPLVWVWMEGRSGRFNQLLFAFFQIHLSPSPPFLPEFDHGSVSSPSITPILFSLPHSHIWGRVGPTALAWPGVPFVPSLCFSRPGPNLVLSHPMGPLINNHLPFIATCPILNCTDSQRSSCWPKSPSRWTKWFKAIRTALPCSSNSQSISDMNRYVSTVTFDQFNNHLY